MGWLFEDEVGEREEGGGVEEDEETDEERVIEEGVKEAFGEAAFDGFGFLCKGVAEVAQLFCGEGFLE